MKSPKAPQPTQSEIQLEKRQTEEMARLDEEENRRVKGLVRRRLGGKSLIGSGRAAGTAQGGSSSSGAGTSSNTSRSVQGLSGSYGGY